jgi:two-component system chemotaxis response regulator CheY
MAISQNIHILLIDENRTDLVTVKDLLTKTGFKNIKYAFNGDDGIKYVVDSEAERKPVQLIICNYEMSSLDGVSVYQKIKEVAPSGPKFLLLSGNSEQQHILKAVKAGVRNILLKPFSKQSLVTELAKMLK